MSTDWEMAALKAAASSWTVALAEMSVAGILVFDFSNWRRLRLAMLLLISGSAKEDTTSRWLKNSTRRRSNRQVFLVHMTRYRCRDRCLSKWASGRALTSLIRSCDLALGYGCSRKPPQVKTSATQPATLSSRTCRKHHCRSLTTAAPSSGPRSLVGPRHALGGPPAFYAHGASPSPQTQHLAAKHWLMALR